MFAINLPQMVSLGVAAINQCKDASLQQGSGNTTVTINHAGSQRAAAKEGNLLELARERVPLTICMLALGPEVVVVVDCWTGGTQRTGRNGRKGAADYLLCIILHRNCRPQGKDAKVKKPQVQPATIPTIQQTKGLFRKGKKGREIKSEND
ncbi:hypothetical protein BJX99DRAFT_101623 [Aspergillus californicus]